MNLEYKSLDINQASEDEITTIIKENNRTYKLMLAEIKSLKEAAQKNTKSQHQSTISITTEKLFPPEELKDTDFENEVDYYYALIKELGEENLEEKLIEILPSRKNYHYEKILFRIRAEIMRNIKGIKDLFNEEGISLEETPAFKDEVTLELKKLDIIIKEQQTKETLSEEYIDKNNNLILAPTTGGNIRILDEIEKIDTEYYERFYKLLNSIKDGTFKNVRRFLNYDDLAGLCEVKDFKVRVLFKRLDKNSYAIISAFVKKNR